MKINRKQNGTRRHSKWIHSQNSKNQCDGKLLHKLLDMGFVNGTHIEVIREAPLYDPMELKIHNYYISLRKSEAKLIEVAQL